MPGKDGADSTEEMAYEDDHHTLVLATSGSVQRFERYRLSCNIIDLYVTSFLNGGRGWKRRLRPFLNIRISTATARRHGLWRGWLCRGYHVVQSAMMAPFCCFYIGVTEGTLQALS